MHFNPLVVERMYKQLEGIYPSIESVLEKVQQLLGKNLAIDQQTLVTNKDKQEVLREFETAIRDALYGNDPLLLKKVTWLVHHVEADEIFAFEKFHLNEKEEQEQYNRAMAELNYVLLFGQATNSDYWYPKKRLGQSITDLEGNKEFNHQADFINSGSANSDISSPRFNGTYTNQPWLEPNSDRNATK